MRKELLWGAVLSLCRCQVLGKNREEEEEKNVSLFFVVLLVCVGWPLL